MKTTLCLALLIVCTTVSSRVYAADCTESSTIKQLLDASVASEQAFVEQNRGNLLKQAVIVREQIIPCLKQPLSPKDAAAFHRLMAMEAFTRHDHKRVLSEFHAARLYDPGYTIPPEVADSDHPLVVSYNEAANVSDGVPESIQIPPEAHVLVGGVRSAPRLSDTPALIQVYGSELDESWIETTYIQPGETLPSWGKNPFGITAEDLGIDQTPEWKKPEWYYIPASISAGLAITFYALSLNEKAQFNDPSTPDGQLSAHRDRATGFGGAAIGTAGAAAILTGVWIGIQFGYGGEDGLKIQPAVVSPPPLDVPSGMGGLP